MTHLNYQDNDEEEFRTFPRYRFLVSLVENEFYWTDDNEEFYLLIDDGLGFGDSKRRVGAYVKLDCIEVNGLEWSICRANTVHIRSIIVPEDLRGVGLWGVVCTTLLRLAEDAGVFIHGVARPFDTEVPYMTSMEDINKWRAAGGFDKSFRYERTWRAAKKKSKSLLGGYLNNGYCRYDLSGQGMSNRFFRECGFGYASSKIDNNRLREFCENRLSC